MFNELQLPHMTVWLSAILIWATLTGIAIVIAGTLSPFGVLGYISVLLLPVMTSTLKQIAGRPQKPIHFLLSALLILVQLLPLGIAVGTVWACDQLHRQITDRIIAPALQAYINDHGSLPSDPSALVPNYLAQSPNLPCLSVFYTVTDSVATLRSMYTRDGDWGWTECYSEQDISDRDHAIYFPFIGLFGWRSYTLRTNKWLFTGRFDVSLCQ
jgi:hypothetical protein